MTMFSPRLDDPTLPLSELFLGWPELSEVFLSRHMLCFGCPIAPFHTVIDACCDYSLDEAEFRAALKARAATVRL
jgi:hybrid cluster-associated redox disulfide protein